MKTIINLVLHGFVLWAAWQLFPDIVQFDSFSTLVLVTVLLFIIALVIGAICLLILGASILIGDVGGFIVGLIIFFVMALLADVIGLDFLSYHIQGFTVVGFWPKVLLAILFSIFSVGSVEYKRG